MVGVSPPIHRLHNQCIPPKAQLTPLSLKRLFHQQISNVQPLPTLDAEAGISLRTAYKCLAPYRLGGHASQRMDGKLTAPRGGDSIRRNRNTRWTSGTSAAPSGRSPGIWALLSPRTDGS